MAEEKDNKLSSYLDRLKQQAATQQHYGGDINPEEAKMDIRDCPGCGAGRAFEKGLTACAYCGFVFMEVKLTDGVNIKKENNS